MHMQRCARQCSLEGMQTTRKSQLSGTKLKHGIRTYLAKELEVELLAELGDLLGAGLRGHTRRGAVGQNDVGDLAGLDVLKELGDLLLVRGVELARADGVRGDVSLLSDLLACVLELGLVAGDNVRDEASL